MLPVDQPPCGGELIFFSQIGVQCFIKLATRCKQKRQKSTSPQMAVACAALLSYMTTGSHTS